MKKFSRRDFINSLTHAASCIYLPGIISLLHSRQLLADSDCAAPTIDNSVPAFIGLDLRGGASIAGNNVIVYDQHGELLSSYRALGLPEALHPNRRGMIDTTLGLPMHTLSPMLAGIRDVASGTVLNKVNGCVICTRSADDTSNNELASAPGVFLAGAKGQIVPLVGTAESVAGGSGGNSITPFITSVAPTRITDIESAKRLVSVGAMWERASPKLQFNLLQLVKNLSSLQLQRFTELGLSQQAKQLAECGYLRTRDMLIGNNPDSRASIVDPRQDQALQGAGYFNQNQAALEIGYLVLKGYAASGTIAVGGFDYHDNTVASGEMMDRVAGNVIGTLLAMASDLGRKLMLHVYTDGGVGGGSATMPAGDSGADKYVWQGDSEVRSAAFVLVFDPAGRPQVEFQQMGAYKASDGGSIDLNPNQHSAISDNPAAQAAAVVSNWLAWQGREGEGFRRISRFSPITEANLDNYLFIRG